MNKLLVILGPTSTGKTDLALLFAQKFNGEIISADSRQIYKKLDIGTGKMPSRSLRIKKGEGYWEIDNIKVWMYDVISPNKQYTVADYVRDANKVISKIVKKGKLPIIVGGTGFYIKALIDGLPNLSIPLDEKLRKALQNLSLEDLQNRLKQISEKKWESMNYSDQRNPRRLIRAIEVEIGKKDKKTEDVQEPIKEFNFFKIGLKTSRNILYQRSDRRVIDRINQGMIEEAARLKKEGLSLKRMRQLGLEYGVLADFLEGKIKTKEEFTKILQNKIHGYIRRQSTWFKKEKNILWFDISKKDFSSKVEKKIGQWYH